MTLDRIDQVVPTLASRDAIGGHVLELRDLIRSMGLRSDVYFANASPDRLGDGLPLARLGDRRPAGRALLYQLSIGSGVADLFRDRPERKFVNYHNITPAELIEDWLPAVGDEVRLGRAQMRALGAVTDFAVADSHFNEGELRRAGYRATATASLLIDLERFEGEADRRLAERLGAERGRGGADLLFVGKVSPHKGQHDLVKALAAYRRLYDPRARLRIVGGPISADYQSAVERFAKELGLADAVDFAGSVSHGELIAYYQAADVFLCLSDHEGFCVPVLEAMHHGLPVVAHDNTAVPETLGGAGLVLPDKEPARVAAAVDRVVRDEQLRRTLAEAAAARVSTFALPRAREVFAAALERACAD